MNLLLSLLIPVVLLVGATFLLSKGQGRLRGKLFSFEVSGRSAQIWNLGIIAMVVISVVLYFLRR